MKFHAAGIASLLVAVPIGISAARNGLSVTENDIEFDVACFDDGRIRPYRVVFWDENVRNLYDFDSSGRVQIFRIGTERYRVSADACNDRGSTFLENKIMFRPGSITPC